MISAASEARTHPSSWLLLLPLPILFIAFIGYDLGANIGIDYRWLLACVVAWHAVCAALATWTSRRGSPWTAALAFTAGLPALGGLLVFVGPVVVATAVLMALAALGVGSFANRDVGASAATSMIVGLACIAAFVGWLLPFPVHHRWVYLLVVVAMIVVRRRNIAEQARGAAKTLCELASIHPQWLILLLGAASIASLGLWLPSLNYDDNAVHLILPSQLLFDGYYHLDVQTQSWAVAPWANNVLHGVAMMLAGGEARPAVAVLWLLLGIVGAWRLARALDASPGVAVAAAAVFASQPLTGYFTTSMQVDGASTAILLNLAAMIFGPGRRSLGAGVIGAICGLLLALKTSNLLYMVPLMVGVVAMQPAGTRLRWSAKMLATLFLVGGSSYLYAVLVTGNPVFPFYNAVFQSPYYPLENFRDKRWLSGISWRSPWDMTFRSNAYGEIYPGAAGIALLALLPAMALDAVRRPASRWLLLWAFGTGFLVFFFVQYLRYTFPAVSVLAVLGVVALSRVADRRALVVALVVIVLANAALMPTTSWIARDNHWAQLLREGPGARDDIVRRVMPERALLQRVMAQSPDACVLMTNGEQPFVGVGHGHAISMHRRYDPVLWRARKEADLDATGERWVALLARIGPSMVIVDTVNQPLLANALASSGYVIQAREGSLDEWVSKSGAACHSPLLELRSKQKRTRWLEFLS